MNGSQTGGPPSWPPGGPGLDDEVLQAEVIRELGNRLSRIEGQIRGIRAMTAERRSCLDTVTQIAAVRGALRRVADIVVASHVEGWVKQRASETDDASDGEDIQELLKVFSRY